MNTTALNTPRSLERRAGQVFDVLVVGGGIVGAGIARDAAMRGLKTALVEQNDFASGTSSSSSRLLHGGIRYLAQGRIGLVREASREKTVLRDIAPHLSEPLAFVFPTRRRSEWPKWKLAVGVKIYDLLCGRQNLGRSRVLSLSQTTEMLPALATDNLTGAVRYYDGLTNDARLVIDTLKSAAHYGAVLNNYSRFVDSQYDASQKVWRCQVEQQPSGDSVELVARCLVNAAGPWSHKLPHSKTSLRLTKGVHLVLDRKKLPVPDAVVMTEGDRILFVIPWGERIIVGTTDTDYDGDIAAPRCLPSDTCYVLDALNESFPGINVDESDVLSTWAGLRPLVADPNGDPSDISRRHEIKMSSTAWWDVTGGKLTTYRLMAEETVDSIAKFLATEVAPCRTASEPLLHALPAQYKSGVLPPEVNIEVVQQYCRDEWALHLDDVMIRRTSWRYYHANHLEIAADVANWMASLLGWSESEMESELARYAMLTANTP